MGAGRRLVTLLAAAQVWVALAGLWFPAQAAPQLPPSEWVAGPNKRVVLLTFQGKTTNKGLDFVLRVLEERSVKASFFLPGRWVRYHQRRAARIRRAGHALGNRGYGDAPFTSLDNARLRASISKA